MCGSHQFNVLKKKIICVIFSSYWCHSRFICLVPTTSESVERRRIHSGSIQLILAQLVNFTSLAIFTSCDKRNSLLDIHISLHLVHGHFKS